MKTINAIILAVVVLFIACAQPPVAPRLNVNVRVLQEEQTSNPDEDPQFEVTPTILPFGLAFTSLDLQVSNAGGGTVDYSITGLPNYLSASSVSGTLSAGEVKKIAVTIDRSKLNSGSHSGSFKVNDETISVSADVAEVTLDNWYVVPVKDAALVRTDKGESGKIYPCVERFAVDRPGVYRFKGIQVDDSNSYEQLDESWFVGVYDHTTKKYARCTNATITANVADHGELSIFPVIDFARHYSGPRNADCGEFQLEVEHEYEIILFHAVLVRDDLNPDDIHQDFQGPQSVKVATFLAKEK